MRRGASIAGWMLPLALLVAAVGCSWPSVRRGRPQKPLTQQQSAAVQQISERAQAAIDAGDLEQARVELLQVVALAPTSSESHQRLGKVFQLQGRLNEAEACFRKALERDPDYVSALIGVGSIEAAKGDVPSALKRFETAIEIEPHEAEAHFVYAQLLEATGRADQALAAYFRTLECNPLHALVSQRIGAIQLDRNQPDQALARLDQAVEIDPASGEARFLRGQAHLALHHLPQAVADFRAAARQLTDRADVYYQLALALEAAHEPADALRAAEHALRLVPDFAAARDLTHRLRR
jgi:tetratricopeptide (TPR) repeat protein